MNDFKEFDNPWSAETSEWFGEEKDKWFEGGEFTNISNQPEQVQGLLSFGSNGFTNVRLQNGKIVSIPIYCRVKRVKFNTDKTREEFTIIDWPYENKLASVKCENRGESRFGAIDYLRGGGIEFNKSVGKLSFGNYSVPAYTSDSNPIPNGEHKIWLPDYPHGLGTSYLSKTKYACIWFRLGDESSDRYLRVGNVSAGCVSVGKSSSSDSSSENELWNAVYDYLSKRRLGNKYVGTLKVIS